VALSKECADSSFSLSSSVCEIASRSASVPRPLPLQRTDFRPNPRCISTEVSPSGLGYGLRSSTIDRVAGVGVATRGRRCQPAPSYRGERLGVLRSLTQGRLGGDSSESQRPTALCRANPRRRDTSSGRRASRSAPRRHRGSPDDADPRRPDNLVGLGPLLPRGPASAPRLGPGLRR
jgi:hypothetical protein